MALEIAGAQVPGRVRLINVDLLFTPNYAYRDSIFYRGRDVSVRGPDGDHLSAVGDTILESTIARALRSDGVLEAR